MKYHVVQGENYDACAWKITKNAITKKNLALGAQKNMNKKPMNKDLAV